MALLGRYKQQPNERRKRAIDYILFLEDDEEITTVTADVTPVTDPPLEVPLINISDSGKLFAYFIEGGVDGEVYTVAFTVTTSGTQRIEDEIEYTIEEVS